MADKDINIDEVSIQNDAAEQNVTADDNARDTIAPENLDAASAAQVDALIAEIKDLNDKYLRTAAELENTRRRSSLDCESAARNRAISVAKNFLPVMDAIDAAQQHAPDDAGILAMARAMQAAFDQIGITRVKSVGEPLNPALHNAVQVATAPADMQPAPAPNTVISELQSGYTIGDAVIRPAMVVVAK